MIQRYLERMLEKRDEGGFTLIELLIVIIILAILAAIVVFAVGSTGSNSKYAACNADAKSFETAMESYKAQLGFYPGTSGTIQNGSSLSASVQTWTVGGTATSTAAGPFLRSLPSTTHYAVVTDGNGGVYVLPAGTNIASVTYSSSATGSLSAKQVGPNATVSTFVNGNTTGDSTSLNYDTNNGAICSDAGVVQ